MTLPEVGGWVANYLVNHGTITVSRELKAANGSLARQL